MVSCYKLGCTGKGKLEPGLCTSGKQSLSPSLRARLYLVAMQCQSLPGTAWWAAAVSGLCLCCGPCSLLVLIHEIHEQHWFVCSSTEHVTALSLPAQVAQSYPTKLKPATTFIPSLLSQREGTLKHRSLEQTNTCNTKWDKYRQIHTWYEIGGVMFLQACWPPLANPARRWLECGCGAQGCGMYTVWWLSLLLATSGAWHKATTTKAHLNNSHIHSRCWPHGLSL